MIAHDICYPSFGSFCQKEIESELESRAISFFGVASEGEVVAEFFLFEDDSVAVLLPNQNYKAYPSIQFVRFN